MSKTQKDLVDLMLTGGVKDIKQTELQEIGLVQLAVGLVPSVTTKLLVSGCFSPLSCLAGPTEARFTALLFGFNRDECF